MFKIINLLVIFIITLFVNCTNTPEPENNTLKNICTPNDFVIACYNVASLSAQSVKEDVAASPFLEDNLKNRGLLGNAGIRYDIEAIKVIYPVTYNGKKVNSSAIIMRPKRDGKLSLTLTAHGTQIDANETPSTWNLKKFNLKSFFAIPNTIAYLPAILYDSMIGGSYSIMPDYLGHGDSAKDFFHPFHIAESYAVDGIAAIRAARELAKQIKIPLNDNVFLRGYSEGGYATLALQRRIEQDTNLYNEIKITASAPAAGAYSLTYTVNWLRMQPTFDIPSYLPYVYLGYANSYNWNKSETNDFFKAPYADKIINNNLYDGSKTSSQVNDALTKTINDLLTENFKNLNENIPSIKTFKDRISNNDLHTGWIPKTPTRFYVCKGDTIVPPDNTIVHVAELVNNTTKTPAEHPNLDRNLSAIIAAEGGSHAVCSTYGIAITEWFNKF